ncbi:MAG: DNA polymerase III subunit chi [Methylotetracoccus sp.]|jgi:DNA polymerase-3 subunit chi|nr:DNA polymerase III subunit chi [Methylotetracoccus sp.]
MTRIDFYVVPGTEVRQRHLIACRLAEKAYRLGHRLYIQTASSRDDALLDDLLWTFRQNSFIPHARWPGVDDPDLPVLLGHDPPPVFLHELLIHLADPIPEAFGRFARVVEIINADETVRAAARRRYRFYQERALTPVTHQLTAAEEELL